jgi:hypothetical protein
VEELEYYGREQQRKRNLEKGIARNKNVEREKTTIKPYLEYYRQTQRKKNLFS